MDVTCLCCDGRIRYDKVVRVDPDEPTCEYEEVVCFPCAAWLGLPVCSRCGEGWEAPDLCGDCDADLWSPETIRELRAEARGARV